MLKFYHKMIVLVLFLLLFAAGGYASGDADAIYLELNKTYTLNEDGSMRYEYHHRVKLLTFYAVNRYQGETFVVTNPDYQTLTVDLSETTMADGRVVPSPENAFNEVLPRFAHNAPAYANLREMVITHTALEKGAVVELRYHIDTKPGFLPWLMGEEIFGNRSPIEKMTVTVNVPTGAGLQYHLFNGTIKPEVESDTHFRWELENIPLITREAGHLPFGEFSPRLVFSTCPDWNTLSAYLAKDFYGEDALPETVVKTLMKGIETGNPQARILAIRDRVVNTLGLVNLDPRFTGYSVAAPEETFSRNYGTKLDKALLIKALLTEEGIESHIGLVSTGRQFSSVVPSLLQYTDCVVFAQLNGSEVMVLLPDGDQPKQGQYDLAGHVLFSTGEKEPLVMKVDETGSEANYVKVKADLKMDDALNLTGKVMVQTAGYGHDGYALAASDTKDDFIDGILDDILGNGDVVQVRTVSQDTYKGTYEADYTGKNLFEKAGDSDLYFYDGLMSAVDAWHIPASLVVRLTPLMLQSAFSEHLDVTIQLPEGYAIKSTPGEFNLTNDAGHLMWRWTIEGDVLHVERQLVLTKRDILPENYPDFRKLIVNFEAKNGRVFVIEK